MKEEKENWVFLSHSNKDFNKVRIIRNLLEEECFRPIMFFLKALEEETNDEKLLDLLHKEIDARNLFILCDSENAKNAYWVKEEIKYIQSKERSFQIIDLNDVNDNKKLLSEIKRFKRRSTIFLSHSPYDDNEANEVIGFLTDKSFDVFDWTFLDASCGVNLNQQIEDIIDKKFERGYFVALLSRSYLSCLYGFEELSFALKSQNNHKRIFLFNIDDSLNSDDIIEKFGSLPSDINIHNISPNRKTNDHTDYMSDFLRIRNRIFDITGDTMPFKKV